MSTLYRVLGLPRGANQHQVKAAFRTLARQFHPDVNAGDETAGERFKEVNRAYETLVNPEARAAYDRALMCQQEESETSIPCYVLADGTRVLAQRGLQSGIGLSEGGIGGGARKIAVLMARLAERGIETRDLAARANSPIWFIPPHGGNPASGYEAGILPD